MRAQYKGSDFKKLERGKFYQRVVAGSNVVVLEPKVAKAFPSSAIVNQTLNDLLELARKSSRLKPRPRRIKSACRGKLGAVTFCRPTEKY
jgi:hypothetical protein